MNEDVIRYYSDTQSLYDKNWDKNHMHYGYWDEKTKIMISALENLVFHVTQKLRITNKSIILDAGCGVGGACRFVSKHFNPSKITGITISPLQVEMAYNKNNIVSENNNIYNNIEYKEMDFVRTEFIDGSFDGIYSIESVCHSESKYDFLKEAKRIIKPGGRISISDYFLVRDYIDEQEKKKYSDWMKGWAMPHLSHIDEFEQMMKDLGFDNIELLNVSTKIEKTSRYMKTISKRNRAIIYIPNKLKLIPQTWYPNTIAGIYQFDLLKSGLWQYYIISADRL